MYAEDREALINVVLEAERTACKEARAEAGLLLEVINRAWGLMPATTRIIEKDLYIENIEREDFLAVADLLGVRTQVRRDGAYYFVRYPKVDSADVPQILIFAPAGQEAQLELPLLRSSKAKP